jgi:hypothetical protein
MSITLEQALEFKKIKRNISKHKQKGARFKHKITQTTSTKKMIFMMNPNAI